MTNSIVNIPLKYKFWLVNGFSFLGMGCLSLFAIYREHTFANDGGDFFSHFMASAISYAPLVLVLMLVVLSASQILIRFVESHIYQLRDAMSKAEKQGDMTVRVSSTSNDEIGQMSQSFNSMQDKFHQILTTMKEMSDSGSQLSTELNSILEATASAMNQQLDASKDTTSTTEELRQATHTINEHTHEAKSATRQAADNVAQGQTTLEQMTQSVQKLSQDMESTASLVNHLAEESTNIGSFLEVIRNISEQTNLLALNAAIEAARAGESGRGFAVVADEVRTLAIKTHDATDKIKEIVERFMEGTSRSVTSLNHNQCQAAESATLVEEAQGAFTQIATVVHQINASSQEIAKETDHQSKLTEDVMAKITHIQQLAEDTSNNGEQAHDISVRLQSVSTEMDETTALFKIH